MFKKLSSPQIGHCYKEQLANFPQELAELLLNHHTVLETDLRMVCDQHFSQNFLVDLWLVFKHAHRCLQTVGAIHRNDPLLICFSQTFCKALILLRNKDLINPTSLLELFFELLRCHDKLLRKVTKKHQKSSMIQWIKYSLPCTMNEGISLK